MGTWGSGVVGGEEVGGEAADFAGFPFLRCLFALLRGGRQRISATSPFALPFRLLAGFKGNGFRRVSLFALPFALLRGGEAANFSDFPIYVAF